MKVEIADENMSVILLCYIAYINIKENDLFLELLF